MSELVIGNGIIEDGGSGGGVTAPTAVDDAYSTAYGTPLVVAAGSGVLANDTGTGMTAVKQTDPTHGTVTLNSDGSLTYTPAVGYSGSDTFTYKAHNTGGNSNTATVTITIAVPAVSLLGTYRTISGVSPLSKHSLAFSTFTGATSVNWDFGDGTGLHAVTVPNYTAYSTTANTYTVTRYLGAANPTALTFSNTQAGFTNLTLVMPNLTSLSITQVGTALNSIDISSCVALANVVIYAGINLDSAVDSILVSLAAGSVSNGVCNLTGNVAPSSVGLAAKAILVGRGWTVTTY